MAQMNFTPLVPGAPEDVNQLNTILTAAQTAVNSVDETQIAVTTLKRLGLNNGSQIGRGSSVTTTTETTASTSYVKLATPDQVASVVLPASGHINLTFEALWLGTVTSNAAIFLGSTQILSYNGATAQAVTHPGGGAPKWQVLYSTSGGLTTTNDVTDSVAPASTGQAMIAIGLRIYAAAGTYTVSVQFRDTAANVLSVKQRRLYVQAWGP